VQVVLAQAADDPDPDADPLPIGAPADGPRAAFRTAPIRLGANGRRALFVDVRAREAVTATVVITRDGRMLAHKTVKGVRGMRHIRVDIPPRAKAGPARLRLTLRNAAGVSKVITRNIQIPRALPVTKP
jgi:hypothetical protein